MDFCPFCNLEVAPADPKRRQTDRGVAHENCVESLGKNPKLAHLPKDSPRTQEKSSGLNIPETPLCPTCKRVLSKVGKNKKGQIVLSCQWCEELYRYTLDQYLNG